MKSLVYLIVIGMAVYAAYRAYQSAQEETSESRTIKSLPPSIQHVVARLDPEAQNAFFNEYEKKKKKKSVAWVVWLFLGWHYLYTGKVGLQFAFWFTLGGFGVWWFVDFFRIPSIVRSANEQIARSAIQTLAIAASFGTSALAPTT
jgi:TM2 domain-containing membrane protein YozV